MVQFLKLLGVLEKKKSSKKKMLANMNARGLYPIADVVVNHKGTKNWTDFTNPTWGVKRFVVMMMLLILLKCLYRMQTFSGAGHW